MINEHFTILWGYDRPVMADWCQTTIGLANDEPTAQMEETVMGDFKRHTVMPSGKRTLRTLTLSPKCTEL